MPREMVHKMWVKVKKILLYHIWNPFEFYSFHLLVCVCACVWWQIEKKNGYLISHVFDTYYHHAVDIFLSVIRASPSFLPLLMLCISYICALLYESIWYGCSTFSAHRIADFWNDSVEAFALSLARTPTKR